MLMLVVLLGITRRLSASASAFEPFWRSVNPGYTINTPQHKNSVSSGSTNLNEVKGKGQAEILQRSLFLRHEGQSRRRLQAPKVCETFWLPEKFGRNKTKQSPRHDKTINGN